MQQYGDLIDEDDDTLISQVKPDTKNNNQNFAKIPEIVEACGKECIE